MELKILAWAIGIIVCNCINYYLISNLVIPKYNKWFCIGIFSVLNIVEQSFKDIFLKEIAWIYPLYLVIIFSLIFVLFKGKWSKKILAFVDLIVVVIFSEIIAVNIIFGVLGYSLDVMKEFTWFRLSVNWFCSAIFLIGVYIILSIQKPYKFITVFKEQATIFICILVNGIQCSLYCIILIACRENSGFLFWIYLVISIITDVMIVQTLGELEVKNESKELLEKLQFKDNSMRQYYQAETEKLLNFDKLKDNYEKKLSNIYENLGKEYISNSEEKSISESTLNIDEKSKMNQVIYSVIRNKEAEMKMIDCPYKVNINIENDINMELLDLSSLVNNLFDNAIEAVKTYKLTKKTKETKNFDGALIYADIYTKGNKFILDVKNIKSSNQKIVEYGGKIVTSKEEKIGHGYGLGIIRSIAQKYNGKMEIDYSKNAFENKVIISQ